MFNNVLCYCRAINNDGNKWLLLNVNPKTRFLDVHKIPKAPKNFKCLLKKSRVIWLKTIDFFLLSKIFCDYSVHTYVFKKISLVNSISNQKIRAWFMVVFVIPLGRIWYPERDPGAAGGAGLYSSFLLWSLYLRKEAFLISGRVVRGLAKFVPTPAGNSEKLNRNSGQSSSHQSSPIVSTNGQNGKERHW